MSTIPTEIRSDIYRRLVMSGDWQKASDFMAEQRAAFVAQGKNRAEAKDLAWEALSEKFPPPREDTPTAGFLEELAIRILSARRPPHDCAPPAPGRYSVEDCWYANESRHVIAFIRDRHQGPDGDPRHGEWAAGLMQDFTDEAPTEEARELCVMLQNEPRRFCTIAQQVFDVERQHRLTLEPTEKNKYEGDLMERYAAQMPDLAEELERAAA